jgi:2-dehydropantoate 2-reductase
MRKRTSTRLIHNATNHDENTLYILGVGNLGKYVAYALAKHVPDQPITLLFHREGLLHEWDAAGRTIECIKDGESSREGSFAVEVLSSPDIAEKDDESQVCSGPPIKHLIVATKTYNTTAALRRVRSRLSRESNILFLQNGMGMFMLSSRSGLGTNVHVARNN